MGKKYYCDYCDRSFKDASNARKKHLTGLQHVKNQSEHYLHFKDPEKIYQEESQKKPCQRFHFQGSCQFENLCRYSHYTAEMIEQLRTIVAVRAEAKRKIKLPDLEKIKKEFFEDILDPEEITESDFNLWPLPAELQHQPNLPPSLWPISYKSFAASNFPEWGQR